MTETDEIDEILADLGSRCTFKPPEDQIKEMRRLLSMYGRRKLKETAEDAILRLFNCVWTLQRDGYTQNRAGRWIPPRET